MKEFYVMNLDARRIAILAGGAFVALGITLFIGMSIGRSQSTATQRLNTESDIAKTEETKLESADKLVLASGPSSVPMKDFNETKNEIPSVPPLPSKREINQDIPLQEDPLVSGPPKTKLHKAHKTTTHSKNKVSGDTKASKKRTHKRSSLADDADEQLAPVAGTAKAKRIGETRYTIQVAAFKQASQANHLIDKLKSEGIRARSEKSGNYFLVTVGRSKSKSKLDKAYAKLKELEYNVYIRKLSPPPDAT
ncbi:MAG TPA: SPOR domain-containing protein [Turneriella sp.]|nr:SPOR domain-containing protein [Turneriella sp.]